jgi:hypothetical protein
MITYDFENRTLSERFDRLLQIFSSERFLTMQSIGNEVPFFICPYNPEEQEEMVKTIDNLAIQLQHRGVQVERINLYDLCLDTIRQEEDAWTVLVQEETSHDKDVLLEQLQMMLAPEFHLAPEIVKRLEEKTYHILFIDGVGEVYPYVRTHSLLENLEKYLNHKPLILFFPGKYRQTLHAGASLELFKRLHDDKYYRAFNIYRYEP